MPIFSKEANRLIYHYDAETLWIEPWGDNSLRVRATVECVMPDSAGALLEQPEPHADICIGEKESSIRNGILTAVISSGGHLRMYNSAGKLLLDEYHRNRRDLYAEKCSALEVEGREFRPIPKGDYNLTARFESLDPSEKIYGMGQYQQPYLNLKGTDIELAHRNSQSSVPFMLSSLGYGLLWNNPAVGRAVFGKNIMSFEAMATQLLDYWVTAGGAPAEIMEQYTAVTGRVPMMPDYGMGFWQCKLRYQTQDELLQVAREYKRCGLPISVIVVDFFHWIKQGDWKFDPRYWPDPQGMVAELKEMGIELMVSVWPTVDKESENYQEMLREGYLTRVDRGARVGLEFQGATIHFDATNPNARRYVWEKCKQNYYDNGIRIFWMDEAEPEYSAYDFDNYRYHIGTHAQKGNLYPVHYAQMMYEGQQAAGQKNIINLIRCAWAGSQRYGTLVWSGDIASSFDSLRNQMIAGLNMGIAGIPWWTTDIGGFHGGNPSDSAFRELLIRWFQYAAFCPVMRLHGDREPRQVPSGITEGIHCPSGADNEVWSFGEDAYVILKRYLSIREKLAPYITGLMQAAHEKGAPVMRPCFYEFPDDAPAWEVEDAYMFGPNLLVAPVTEAKADMRNVYLPAGASWIHVWTQKAYSGGQVVKVPVTIENIPLFVREGAEGLIDILNAD